MQKKVFTRYQRILSGFLCVAGLFVSEAWGQGESSKKLLMAVLGDSISAATLADVPIPSSDPPETRVQRWEELELDARFLLQNKWALSWASGHQIDSQFRKLERWLRSHGESRTLDVLNVAAPGAKASNLEGQVEEVLRRFDTGEYDSILYATILIGANDACSTESAMGTPLERMQEDLLRAFRILSSVRQSEPIRVLVLGVPRIPDLGATNFREASTLFGLKCETVRHKLLGLCDPLLLWKTPEEYEEKMRIVENKNRALRQGVELARTLYPNLDLVYSDRLYQLKIPLEILAADCFHPGKMAQGRIADETWNDQPWFKDRLR